MQWILVNQDKLMFLLYGLKIVASGGNGRIYQYDHRTLAKIYLSFLENNYKTFDVEEMILNILKWRSEEKLIKVLFDQYETNYERINWICKRLESTCCSDLIQGAILYEDFALVCLLLDYTKEGYVVYKDVCQNYSYDENYEILNRIQEKVLRLMNEYIYPRDIKFGNVMVRASDLDVRLIDMDDFNTKYEDHKDCFYYAEVLNRIEKMKTRVLKK